MNDCKPKATPREVNLKLVKDHGEQQLVDTKLYRSLVAIYLRALMKDFGYSMKEPTYIGEDNHAVIHQDVL